MARSGVFASYVVLGLLPQADDRLSYAFVLRLTGFVAVVIGLAVKERAPSGAASNRRRPMLFDDVN